MSKQERREYADGELGYITDTLDRPRAEIAENLGRTLTAIDDMRKRVKAGWVRERERWSDDEDNIILGSKNLTSGQIAAKLERRTAEAVKCRRLTLGASVVGGNMNPLWIGQRTLLAKTCTKCGMLLPPAWFVKRKYCSPNDCKKCRSKYSVERHRKTGRNGDYATRAQEISMPTADRKGYPYAEADHTVLADESLTVLGKALKLHRTYAAVGQAVLNKGYKSLKPLGNPENDRWLIDNPNVDRIDEITASLNERELVSAGGRPDFEWDD